MLIKSYEMLKVALPYRIVNLGQLKRPSDTCIPQAHFTIRNFGSQRIFNYVYAENSTRM